MKPAPAEDPALPSWRWPIALGAIMTVVLHVPVLWENVLWVAVCGSFGITGLFCGVLPGWLAMRRDPAPSLSSGFAVSFIAVGSGAIPLAIVTLLRGFKVEPEHEAQWRAQYVGSEINPEVLTDFFARLRGGEGDSWTVLAAALMAFGGGMAGAVIAALRARRTPKKA